MYNLFVCLQRFWLNLEGTSANKIDTISVSTINNGFKSVAKTQKFYEN